MAETEAYTLPTTVFRDQVREMTGRIYSFLLFHLREVIITLFLIIVIILILKFKNYMISKRARKEMPESTNDWFSWEEFEEWKKSERK